MQPTRTVWNYWSLQPKNSHVKELNSYFLEWKSFLAMFSFPALKTPGVLDCSHQSRSCYYFPPTFCFEFLFSLIIKKIIKQTKILFPGFSVNNHDDVFILVSFISIVTLFLVVAFSQINLCQTSSMQASKNKFVLSSARDLQTSNIIFTVGANR